MNLFAIFRSYDFKSATIYSLLGNFINKLKAKAVPLHAMKTLGGRGGITLILNLGTAWG
jgi:hypothetical protein